MLFKNVGAYFSEFCACTSVHGFRYFSEKDRTIFERIWWMLAFSVSLASCVFIIYESYQKWEENAVIVTVSQKPIPLYEIPFPAITVCSESKIPNFDSNGTYADLIEYINLLCDKFPPSVEEFPDFDEESRKSNLSDELLDFLDSAKPDFSYVRRVGSVVIDYEFIPLVTDQGICHSFNVLDRSDIFRTNVLHYKNFHQTPKSNWSLEQGYQKNTNLDYHPARTFLTNVDGGLRLEIVTSKKDLDYGCRATSQGFRVILHTPSTLPSLSKNYFKLSFNQSTQIILKPALTIASNSIRKYDANKRNCYFEKERHLAYFKRYSFSNCQLECRTNLTLTLCKCVLFFMPRQNGTNICRSGLHCAETAQDIAKTDNIFKNIEDSVFENSYLAQLMLESERDILESHFGNITLQRCGCLPSCTELTYNVEVSQNDLDFEKWNSLTKEVTNTSNNRYHITTLDIFFDENQFLASERKELYGPTDFLANFGGLLGLFCGFSVLSLLEILYFLTIRLVCNKNLFGRWTGQNIG